MSEALDHARRRMLLGLSALAGAGVVAGGLSQLKLPARARPAGAGALVFPEFVAASETFSLVMVTTSDEAYHLTRDPSGWVMPEKDLHPVRADRIRALAAALASLRFDRPMTRDARKFDRIGLGDPGAGGWGALVEAGDGSGGVYAKAILGQRDGRTYLRFPDDPQAWAVAGEPMPPLQRAMLWLELDLVDIETDPVVAVEIAAGSAAPYRLLVEGGQVRVDGRPAPVDPAVGVALAETALALGRWAPVDVARGRAGPSARLAGRHRTMLSSGVAIALMFWREGDAVWASVAAEASGGGEAATRASDLARRTEGWRYRLRDGDVQAFLKPLASSDQG